ncbi:MAG: hypothetical protein Q7T72_02925 [Bacteroidales bacterium]|nr:hypothetical protein [Bacteroidales bacterium]
MEVNIKHIVKNQVSFEGDFLVTLIQSEGEYLVRRSIHGFGVLNQNIINASYYLFDEKIEGLGAIHLKFYRNGTAEGFFISSRVDDEAFGFGKIELSKKG